LQKKIDMIKVLGLGNALVDVLLPLESDRSLADTGIVKGAMDMIDANQMVVIQRNLARLKRTQAPGGSVCNSMRALAKLGASAGFIGKIGTDALGDYYEKALLDADVTPYLVRTDGASGCCTVMISPDGERTMATFLGAAPTLSPDDIPEKVVARYGCIYIEGYLLVNEPLVCAAMEKAKKRGVKIALDLSNFNIVNAYKGLLREMVSEYVDILFSNESEAKAFTGLNPAGAVEKISAMVDFAVVTEGNKGALISGRGETVKVAADGRLPVDTTGAGDYFAAGFLYGLLGGATLEQAGRIGSMLAGKVVRAIGPQIPAGWWLPLKANVKDILRKRPRAGIASSVAD
jgi:sugar/nucleoside kinase (ribokinase family)